MHCKQCQMDKDATAFYASNKTRCKECVKASVRANRLDKIDYYRQYDKARASMPQRVAARAEYARTPAGAAAHERARRRYASTDAAKAAKRAYIQSERGKAKRAETMRRQAERFPERHHARTTLGNAVRDGRVIPWPVCAVPDCCGKPQGHHPDYSRPLDVVWLCDAHHKAAHAMVREAA
jgi:hypothetical protein